MKKALLWGILVLTVFAFTLRFYLLPTHLFFGPEQGKDFFEIKNIALESNFTLIGPKTDFEGVFHGPLYYYLASIPFRFSMGDPLVVATFIIMIQSLTVILAFYTGKSIGKSNTVGIITAVLFTCSYGAVIYTRWISGQQLSIPLGFLLLFCLWQLYQGKKRFIYAVALVGGLLGQSQFINFLYVPFILSISLWFIAQKIRISRMTLLSAVSVFFITAWGNFLLFDLKNNFLILKSITSVLLSGKASRSDVLPATLETFHTYGLWLSQFIGVPYHFFSIIGLLFVFSYLIWKAKHKEVWSSILLVWLLVPLSILLLFRKGALDQVFVIIAPAIILSTSLYINWLWIKYGKLVGISIVFGITSISLYQLMSNLPSNHNVFFQAPQPHVRYSDQLRVVDEIYKRVDNTPFEIQAYTIPYFWQDAWKYLFWQKATTHSYLLPQQTEGEKIFVIIQKDYSSPRYQQDWLNHTVSKWGTLKDEFVIGEYTVQERIY
jgi:hypothetical protein